MIRNRPLTISHLRFNFVEIITNDLSRYYNTPNLVHDRANIFPKHIILKFNVRFTKIAKDR
jgi:hypothetical protein